MNVSVPIPTYYEVEVVASELTPTLNDVKQRKRDVNVMAEFAVRQCHLTPLEAEYIEIVQRIRTIKRGDLLTVAVKAEDAKDAAETALQLFLNFMLREECT